MSELQKQEIEAILNSMTARELVAFVKHLEGAWGVKAKVSHPAPLPNSLHSIPEPQTEFDVVLVVCGEQRIQVIKMIRVLTGHGLREARELAVNTPSVILDALPRQEAAEAMQKLVDVGATVELR